MGNECFVSGNQVFERTLTAATWLAVIALFAIGIQVGLDVSTRLLDTAEQMVEVIQSQRDAPAGRQPRLDPNWVAYECADPHSTSPSCPAFWKSLDQGVSASSP